MTTQESNSPDFKFAVVRLATYVDHNLTQPHLLFGSVTLIERERPLPTINLKLESRSVEGPGGGKIFFKRTIMIGDEAIAWYRMAGPTMLTPRPLLEEQHSIRDDVAVCASILYDNPAWPSLGLFVPDFNNSELPFVPAWRNFRIHRRFGDGGPFERVRLDPKAVAFLENRLHVNFADYPEYLGGMVLISPDPILEEVQSFLVPGSGTSADKTVFKFVSKPGRSLKGLTLTLLQQKAELLSQCESMPIPEDGLIEIETPNQTNQISFVVSHADYGVLVYHAPATFVRTMNLEIGVANRTIEINAPMTESPKAPIIKTRFSEISEEINSSIGQPFQVDGLSAYFKASERRKKKELAKALDQKWFMSGQRTEAIEFVRARLLSARISVAIADPYLGPIQLTQFFQFVNRLHVSLSLLTSRLAFGDLPDEDYPEDTVSSKGMANIESTKKKRELTRLKDFSAGLEIFVKRGMQRPRAFVLPGKLPALHDRFLIIDDSVWFMGNSLNALGERASLIVKVPDPESVLADLKEMQKQSKTFDEYFLQRQQPNQDKE